MEIYQINKEIQKVLEIEDEKEQEYLLSQLNLNLEEKVENMTMAMRTFEVGALAIDEEIKRLTQLKNNNKQKAETVKRYIKAGMEDNKITKLEFTNFKLSIAKNPPSVIITDESKLKDYEIEKITHSIDKAKLKKDLKEKEVEGAELIQGTSLRIK